VILVTLGTHRQPMPRLVPPLEQIARDRPELAPFHAQVGATPAPRGWEVHGLLAAQDLAALVGAADVVITHGGPASIAQVRAAGKVPIVVPRHGGHGEHVDDHQLHYARRLSDAREIILVTDVALLFDAVDQYAQRIASLPPPVPHDPSPAIRAFSAIARELLDR
jgi:UDP-N-acetylglucosamine transferase subunit ALG13